jgi:VanZ family protein
MSRLLQVLFWGACISVGVLSLLPVAHLPPMAFDWWDKAQHALAFLVLGGLGLLAYSVKPGRVVFGLLAYGASIELAQATSGWRYGDWQDWSADAVGVGAAYLGWVFWKPDRSHGQISTP